MRPYALLLLLPTLFFIGCSGDVDDPLHPASRANTVKLGLMTGEAPGIPGQLNEREYAALLAVEEINAAGGVNGQRLELVLRYEDNTRPPEQAVTTARELAAAGVVAIIGPNSSRATLAIANGFSIAAGLPLLAHGATSPLISTLVDQDTVYRIPPSDALQGRVLAERLVAEGIGQLSIFHVADPYGQGLMEVLRLRFEELGGEVLTTVASPPSQQSGFAAQAQALYAQGAPQAVAILHFEIATTALIRELLIQQGALPKLYGSDGNMTAITLSNLIPEAAGMRGTIPIADPDGISAQRYRAAFQQRLGRMPPNNFDAASYDAVYLAALAMAQAGQNSAAAIQQALRGVSRADSTNAQIIRAGEFALALSALRNGADIDYDGVTGPIDFDSQGDPSAGFYSYLEIQAGPDQKLQLVPLSTIAVSTPTAD